MRLDPEDIEAIAQRVAEIVRYPTAPGAVRYVDARTVARALNVDREWVYAHAKQLGAVRLGSRRGRLRFDLQRVHRALEGWPPTASKPTPPPNPRRAMSRGVDLLPYES